ncbi:type IV toxin-antitoxin system AbiEi family antitoxin domain-containing protein [Streptomyces mirabilis]|uniref:type IV toxin-antitoxin system AbiEi family antitoxin domain-containing protein n=1 Tax=Streptomyces mirabilis TaxID=68239 RepID=UPI003419FE99
MAVSMDTDGTKSNDAANGTVESTIAALRAELPQLEQQRIAFQERLDAVDSRLEALRAALRSLEALSAVPGPTQGAAEPADAAGPVETARKSPTAEAAEAAEPEGLTEDVVARLAAARGPVRAGDINAGLGRPNLPNKVQGVRNVLNRLVRTGRAERVGRGQYRFVKR